MSDHTFASFLGTSLRVLEREVPQAYAAICGGLAGRNVRVVVDGQAVGLTCSGGAIRLGRSPEDAAVAMRTTRKAILDVIDARCTVLDAVLDDRLELRGTPEVLLAFYDAFLSYVHGAVRAPSFPPLLDAFRGDRVGAPHVRTTRGDEKKAEGA